MPELSVVIPSYNAEDTLGVQLDALVGQAPAIDWELVLCDNGSTDGTVALAESYRDRLNLRVVVSTSGRSCAHARNAGAAASTADRIVFVDADDEVAPGWVEAFARGLDQHLLVAGRFDGERVNDPAILRSRPLQQMDGLQQSDIGPCLPHAGGGNMGVHRAVFESLGGFDETMSCLEDTDFCWRAQLAGVPLVFWPDALLHVRLRASRRGMWTQGRRYGAAHAVLEHRYGWMEPRPAPGTGSEDAGGATGVEVARPSRRRLQGVVDLLHSTRDLGLLTWQLGWHVGHHTWRPDEADRMRPLQPAS